MLKFIGRGSAFTKKQNSAFFSDGNDLVLVDHSMSSFHKLIKEGAANLTETGRADNIYVIVTHTHSDHISGIPMLIHYAYYIMHTPVIVAAPSEEVMNDLLFYIDKLDGCDKKAYSIISTEKLKWVKATIPTEHTPALKGKCFGYLLEIHPDGEAARFWEEVSV